jgi:cytochrome c oxidase assembly protein subunit 11
MFAFGYALVPLYDLVCEITGYNGRNSATTTVADVSSFEPDLSRTVKVEFVTSVGTDLPWKFWTTAKSIQLHPGEMTTVQFYATNRATQPRVGQAIPGVSPTVASKYFRKTECFCFNEQEFEAGETREMPVTFLVDPALPADVDTITLSYSFFRAPDNV